MCRGCGVCRFSDFSCGNRAGIGPMSACGSWRRHPMVDTRPTADPVDGFAEARAATRRVAASQHLEHVIDRSARGPRAGRDAADAVHPGVLLRAGFEIGRHPEILETWVDGMPLSSFVLWAAPALAPWGGRAS